jgi:hypothetical protein
VATHAPIDGLGDRRHAHGALEAHHRDAGVRPFGRIGHTVWENRPNVPTAPFCDSGIQQSACKKGHGAQQWPRNMWAMLEIQSRKDL